MGIFQNPESSPNVENFTNSTSQKPKLIELEMSTKDDNADEREEGEIIDEFEDIISSDEEFSMRKRIEELEAKNAELEKIANISVSGGYNSERYNDYPKKESHHLDRYPLASIDISDDEEYPPAPKMPRISKRRKSTASRHKHLHQNTSSANNHRRRKRSSSPPPAPSYRQSDKILLSLFHEQVAAAASQNSSYPSRRKRKTKKSHSNKSSSSLRRKSREHFINDANDDYNHYDNSFHGDTDQNSHEHFENSDCDRSFLLNRDELRVALARNTIRIDQHAPLKDRLSRRKENTDMYNFVQTIEDSPPDEVEDVEEDVEAVVVEEPQLQKAPTTSPTEEKQESDDSLEEQELRILALKSAMLKKHMVRKKRNENVAYSPSDFDEIYKCISESPSLNNIEDQDACNSMEISPAPSPKMVLSDDDGGIDTKPVDMDIVNSDSECELPAYDEWIPIEQIPLPNNVDFNEEIYNPTPVRFNVMPPEVRYDSPNKNFDSEVDEEEMALRALLLAKMNSPKVNKAVVRKVEPQPVPPPEPVPPPPPMTENIVKVQTPDPDVSLEAETLRNFLIANLQKKKEQPKNSTASVLKDAVRRLTARNASASPSECRKTDIDTEKDLSQAINDMAIADPGIARIRVKSFGSLRASPQEVVIKRSCKPEDEEHQQRTEPKSHDSLGPIVANQIIDETPDSLELKLTDEKPTNGIEIESEMIQKDLLQSEGVETVKIACSMEENSVKSEVIEQVPILEESTAIPSTEELVESPEVTASNSVESGVTEQVPILEESAAIPAIEELENPEITASNGSVSQETGPPTEEGVVEQVPIISAPEQVAAPSELAKDTEKSIKCQPKRGEKHAVTTKDALEKVDRMSKSAEAVLPIEPVANEVSALVDEIVSQTEIKDSEKNSTAGLIQEPDKEKPMVQNLNSSIKEDSKSVELDPKPASKPKLESVKKTIKTLTTARQVKVLPTSIRVQILQNETTSKPSILPKIQTKLPVQQKERPSTIAQKPLSTATRTKIVKPNKVINQPSVDLKRKTLDSNSSQNSQPVPLKKQKIEESNNRLVTSAEIPQHPELIIQLGASESDSEYSDMTEEDIDEEACIRNFFNRNMTISTEYYDIASPISLPMESPCDTPLQPGSPITSRTQTPQPATAHPSVEKSFVNDYFEAKLEQFLKNVRTKVTDSTMRPPMKLQGTDKVAVNSTPVAVRHLPEASQQEYRRLINRMKMLERQKQAKNVQVSVKSSEAGAAAPIIEGGNKFLVRKVLVKNATTTARKPSPAKTVIQKESFASPSKTAQPSSPASPQPAKSKENLLVLYENSYQKTGASIISSLDKSLEMVMEAKTAKMAKLKHEQRLRELRKEMEEVQRNLKEQQEKIAKIYPEICSSHRTVESLKTRRVKINKAVTALGKNVIGPNYSIKNDQKSIILEKSKKLAAEIKLVNTMKLSDLESLEKLNLPESSKVENHKSSISQQSPLLKANAPSQTSETSPSIETQNSSDENLPAQQADDSMQSSRPCPTKPITNDIPVCDKNQSSDIILNHSKEALSKDDIMENHENNLVHEELSSSSNKENDEIGLPPPASDHEEALEMEQPVAVDVVVVVGDGSGDSDNSNDNNKQNNGDIQSPDEKTIEIMDANAKEQNGDDLVGSARLQDYISPLSHLREESYINPNGVVCPYQLMGQCDDKDCKYMHLED